MSSVLSDDQIAQLLPLADLARKVPETKRTLLLWKKEGRRNRYNTKTVYLRCAWLPTLGGCWGSSMEFYNDFIRELQEVE